jgi:hypothetical protein
MNRHTTYSPTSAPGRTANRGVRTGGYADAEDYDSYDSYDDSGDAGDGGSYDEIYEYEDPIDRRWIWVAGVAGVILLVAVICTVVILGGGDSGSVSKTIAAPTPTTAAPAVTTAPPVLTSTVPPAAPAPSAPLSPETVTTVAPSPTATASAAPPPVEAAVPSPRTITYRVTGTRQLLDMVTVVYTDAQGALQTEFNVALPWSRTVTLDPGVDLKSVIATSLTGQLNCSVTDAAGTPIVAQANNSMIATCTQ